MGLFDIFKKKECCICGNEVGLLGNRKLEDGNMCSKCTKKLSPWFEERRHSTVEQIKAQLQYREQNSINLENFQVTRVIGDAYKFYVEEKDGVPTRFFVTDAADYKEKNPDIVAFKDIVSCVTNIEKRREEMKQRNAEGNMVSYNPPRYKVHHNFYIEMGIRNNPYFDSIRFYVNSGVVTLEIVESRGILGNVFGSSSVGLGDFGQRQRYEKYENMCKTIEQIVEDGKRGPAAATQTICDDPRDVLINKIVTASDVETATSAFQTLTKLVENDPTKDLYMDNASYALKLTTERIQAEMQYKAAGTAAPPVQTAAGPKFCPNCGTPATGGKFCESCGSKLD